MGKRELGSQQRQNLIPEGLTWQGETIQTIKTFTQRLEECPCDYWSREGPVTQARNSNYKGKDEQI